MADFLSVFGGVLSGFDTAHRFASLYKANLNPDTTVSLRLEQISGSLLEESRVIAQDGQSAVTVAAQQAARRAG